jgi:DNA mismatch repair protein MSH6
MLTEEFHNNPRVLLGHMACSVNEDKGEVLFLYKLRNGVCPKSYGMNVASMAGIPLEVRFGCAIFEY